MNRKRNHTLLLQRFDFGVSLGPGWQEIMHSEHSVTKFLNVDLDIGGSSGDLVAFLASIETSVVVLSHTGQAASIELAKEFASLEETVLGLVDLVGMLHPEIKDIWDRFEFRRLNIGIQTAHEPYAASFAISAKAVELVAALGFEIFFTFYAPADTA